MEELEIIKKLYKTCKRPVLILSKTGEILWCNPCGMAVNMSKFAKVISNNLGVRNKFHLNSALIGGSCEITYCDNIENGVYIAELFADKDADDLRKYSDIEYLDSVIRNGVSMISSSLQLVYDELGDKIDDEGIMYLNNGMLGCYDMLRGTAMCRDAKRAAVNSGNNIVDLSCLVDDLYAELKTLSQHIPIEFSSRIEPGIFVQCNYDMMYDAIIWLVMDVCRKNAISDLKICLEKHNENAVLSVFAQDNRRIYDDKALRLYRDFADNAVRTRKCVDNLIAAAGAEKYGENGITLPMCEITSIPLKSPQVRYKGDRFSKSRVIFSDIYNLDYFATKKE